ncbi:MAG TPA: TonB-dependent receptor [Gammaproteobacteria bacterium]|jgi:iron complex outermembrane receptor protein|nr:TonB-dependent receptor [Gammaproteobacteria bacterium]
MQDAQPKLTALASAILLVVAAQPMRAVAQDSLEEIIVTARRRAESFQDVPVTISVFDEREIQAAGIEHPRDFISLTPNVTLVETQNQGNAFVTVRGISQARNSEPSVAVIVDGVLMSNPAQFNQELFDVQQIEVLKGAQGAVYGRNAIGGAMVITTREPGDTHESRLRLGYDSGPGMTAQLSGDGPLNKSGTLKYHAAFSYTDTDGYIENTYLNEKADPYKDVSMRARLLWEPNDRLKTDFRIYDSRVNTQALYFNIVGFPSSVPLDVNVTSLPVRVNNPGENNRDLSQLAFKLDYKFDKATLTAITSFDKVTEILTGDAWDFLPITDSFLYKNYGADQNQSQYLDVSTVSQEVRLTSNDTGRFRWIAGAYWIGTDRFISTGNMVDTGGGVFPVYHTPRGLFPYDFATDPVNPSATFLADTQNNNAWAVFGEIGYDITKKTELSFALRYDNDHRENTTDTPAAFLPAGTPPNSTGLVRSHTWSESQPRLTLRFKPTDNLTLYGGFGRGFRSGGFNQTGVGAVALANNILGVNDLFDAEVADTLEFGLKSRLGSRVSLDFSVYDTQAKGSYFFVFLPANSTQNLGNLKKVDYKGYELSVNARITDTFNLVFGYGLTDSEIKDAVDPLTIGNQAPLVTHDTTNVGAHYHKPLGTSGLEFEVRGDYQRLGKTWWEPYNVTVRNPVNLLDLRAGFRNKDWSVMLWERNANNVQYNAEFSPGGFVFKALPRRWGIDYTRQF